MTLSNKLLSNSKLGAECLKSSINYIQIRTSFHNEYKHGPQAISNPKPNYWEWVKEFFNGGGWAFVKQEYNRIKKKPFERIYHKRLSPFETRIFEHFDNDEAYKKWRVWSDSDSLNGFSKCVLTRSPNGHAHFKGYLDTKVPDDGITQMSGFVCLMGPTRPRNKLVQFETHWNWEQYNMFEMKIRGDGRKYNLVLNTGTYRSDLQYYDMHGIPFYTRGGPQWQIIRIPFSKFIFAYKGLVQDEQAILPYADIKFVSITLCDQVTGPFSIEIDYMGLRQEVMPFHEYTAYENYVFPHIRYRPIQVDCAPPQQ